MVTKTVKPPTQKDDLPNGLLTTAQRMDFEDLAKLAEKNDASSQAETLREDSKQQQLEVKSAATELKAALDIAASFAKPGMWWLEPEQFETLWGSKSREQIAAAIAAVMQKHGWEIGGVMDKYGPYIALAMAVGPPALATVQGYKQAISKPAPAPADNP